MSKCRMSNAVFTHRLEVRFRDCDPMGHVNNAVYLTAKTVQVMYDYEREKPVPVPDNIRALLSA
jgi:acyl-CoA thioesterase FadM